MKSIKSIICIIGSVVLALLQFNGFANKTCQNNLEYGFFVISEEDGLVEIVYRIISNDPNEVELAYFYCPEELRPYDLVVPPNVVNSETGIEYDVVGIGDSAFIVRSTGYFVENNYLKSISLPETLQYIGKFAFAENFSLTQILLPQSVVTIDVGAFEKCYALERIDLPKTLKRIPGYAFNSCRSLKMIEIPESCISIGSYAFAGSGVESVTLPASLKDIGEVPWITCYGLSEIEVDSGNQFFASRNGILYNKDFSKMLLWPIASDEVFSLPSTVKTIGAYSLEKFWNQSFSFPEGIENIERGGITYSECEVITLPSSLQYIEEFQPSSASRWIIKGENPPTIYKDNIENSAYFSFIYENTILEVPTKKAKRKYQRHPGWSKAFPNIVDSETLNGVSDIDADEDDTSYEYFTIEGLRVQDPRPGQILLRWHNGKVEKICR